MSKVIPVDFKAVLAAIYKQHGSTLLNSELVEFAFKLGFDNALKECRPLFFAAREIRKGIPKQDSTKFTRAFDSTAHLFPVKTINAQAFYLRALRKAGKKYDTLSKEERSKKLLQTYTLTKGIPPQEFFIELIASFEPSASCDFSTRPWTIIITVDPILEHDAARKTLRAELVAKLHETLPAPVGYEFKDRVKNAP